VTKERRDAVEVHRVSQYRTNRGGGDQNTARKHGRKKKVDERRVGGLNRGCLRSGEGKFAAGKVSW